MNQLNIGVSKTFKLLVIAVAMIVSSILVLWLVHIDSEIQTFEIAVARIKRVTIKRIVDRVGPCSYALRRWDKDLYYIALEATWKPPWKMTIAIGTFSNPEEPIQLIDTIPFPYCRTEKGEGVDIVSLLKVKSSKFPNVIIEKTYTSWKIPPDVFVLEIKDKKSYRYRRINLPVREIGHWTLMQDQSGQYLLMQTIADWWYTRVLIWLSNNLKSWRYEGEAIKIWGEHTLDEPLFMQDSFGRYWIALGNSVWMGSYLNQLRRRKIVDGEVFSISQDNTGRYWIAYVKKDGKILVTVSKDGEKWSLDRLANRYIRRSISFSHYGQLTYLWFWKIDPQPPEGIPIGPWFSSLYVARLKSE